MSPRERIRAIRRESLREIQVVDTKLGVHGKRFDEGLTNVQESLANTQKSVADVQQALQRMELGTRAMGDQLLGAGQQIGVVQSEFQELSRTLVGRMRLMEGRFGRMLDLVDEQLEGELGSIKRRLEILEQKIDPAA